MKSLYLFFSCATLLLALLVSTSTALATGNYIATTTGDLDVDIEDLNFLLLPLTQAELDVEASAWQQALANKVSQLSAMEIEMRKLGATANLLEDAAGELEDLAEATASGDAKALAKIKEDIKETGEKLEVAPEKIEQITEQADPEMAKKAIEKSEELGDKKGELSKQIASLNIDLARLVKRYNTVLDSLEDKGGDVAKMRLYADAVSGIKVDVEDTATAFFAMNEWLRAEDGGILLLTNLIKFLLAIAFVVFLSIMAGKLADRISRHNAVSLLLENFIKVAMRRTVFFIGIIVSLPIIGINIGPVMALIGAAGLVIGLALQGTLSNFASGVLILIYRPYDINDVIQVGGITGIVDSMTLMCTTIKTLDNQLITVPNNNVWNDTITNITGSDQRRVDMVFGISYADDFAKAQQILQTIVQNHPLVLKDPEPNIRVHELGDSSVNLICRPWVKTEDYWDVHWDVIEAVKREFDAQGISIPFPQRDVHFFPAQDSADSAA